MYDEISEVYHLVYSDWQKAIEQQADALNGVIQNEFSGAAVSLLDVSCGIGTQALGLSALGHKVTGSDLSAGAVARAKREALLRGLSINFSVLDMRDCFDVHGSDFDVVLSADNSLPHLTSVTDITRALEGMFKCLKPGGLLVIGVRDYKANEEKSTGQMFPYGVRQFNNDRYFVFQTRDWHGEMYDVGMYFVREATTAQPAIVVSGHSRYFAIASDRLIEIMQNCGFEHVERRDDVMHNLMLIGRKT